MAARRRVASPDEREPGASSAEGSQPGAPLEGGPFQHSQAHAIIDPALVVQHSSQPPQKSVVFAYVLWLLGGWWGLHHVYLGRDDHALLYLTSFGGFSIGWMRDMWRLPEYVRQHNRDAYYCEDVRTAYLVAGRRRHHAAPSCCWRR
jgi:DnaJ family protein C protein 22